MSISPDHGDLVHLATTQFIKGLLLGITLSIFAGLLAARMLLFHSPTTNHHHRPDRNKRLRTPSSNFSSITDRPNDIPNRILLHRKLVQFELALLHQSPLLHFDPAEPESVCFLNFLIAEIIATYRSDPFFMNWLKVHVIQAAVNHNLPNFIDHVSISEFSLGLADHFPLFRHARLVPLSGEPTTNSKRWRIELDIELESLTNVVSRVSTLSQQLQNPTQLNHGPGFRNSGSTLHNEPRHHKPDSQHAAPIPSMNLPANLPPSLQSTSVGSHELEFSDDETPVAFIELGIDTQFVLNWPRPKIAALPVHLVVELVEFRATLALEFHPSSSSTGPVHPALSVSIIPGYKLDVRVSSLLGSRTKLRDVPKIADLITLAIQNYISAEMVEPAFVTIPLPAVPKEQQDVPKDKQPEDVKNVTTHDQATNTPSSGLTDPAQETTTMCTPNPIFGIPPYSKINNTFPGQFNTRPYSKRNAFPQYLRPSPINTSPPGLMLHRPSSVHAFSGTSEHLDPVPDLVRSPSPFPQEHGDVFHLSSSSLPPATLLPASSRPLTTSVAGPQRIYETEVPSLTLPIKRRGQRINPHGESL